MLRRLRAICTRRRLARTFALLTAMALAAPLTLIVVAIFTPLPEELRAAPSGDSVRVLDRHGRLLREVRAEGGTRARWVPLEELGPTVVAALLAAEDQRFFHHHGVDPIAVVRAAFTSAAHLRIVSGASTITMQLARTVRPHPRTLVGKLGEMALALRIEATLTKAQILEQYANRVDFGPTLRGLATASHTWLDKPPRALSLGEAALLAGLPRGPSLYALDRGDRSTARAKARRSVVLARMARLGSITEAERARADAEPVAVIHLHAAAIAPHFVEGLVSGRIRALSPELSAAWPAGVSALTTTLDAPLQRECETIARETVARMTERHVTAASVLVLDNATGDVLAWVGSPDATNVPSLGANDGVLALRQPGSALKPFAYGLAIEALGFTPATLLPDVELHLPTASGAWAPRNYDEVFHGPVRLRDALGSSLNVPAAWTVAQLGVDRFLDHLRALGFDDLQQSASFYGPGLSLGDGEVRLLQLTNAYATLARGGVAKPVRVARSFEPVARGDAPSTTRVTLPESADRRVMPAIAAALVTDMLADRRARLRAFGDFTPLDFDFDVAAKTGTSKGFRDNWTVGFSSAVTVGVWVGNFDGTPMQEVSGISGAGPIFQGVMRAAMRTRTPTRLALSATSIGDEETRVVATDVCALSGERATPSCPDRVRDWLPSAAAESLPACRHHVALRIDRRNGLRAGPGCSDAETEVRVFERYEPEFIAWASAEKRPLAPDESSPFCPIVRTRDPLHDALHNPLDDALHDDDSGAVLVSSRTDGDGTTLAIRRPLDNTRLVLDADLPRDAQRLQVDALAPAGVTALTLLVDGAPFLTKTSPFVFSWPIAPGAHVLAVRAAGHADSAAVHVQVR